MRHLGVKAVIKTAAITLIAFPEPVTTALGIMILCATFVIYRQKSLSNFGDLEGLVKKSLKADEPVGFRRYLDAEQTTVNHHIQLNLFAKSQHSVGESKHTSTPLQNYSWFDNHAVSEKIFHHVLKTSFPQYEVEQELLHQKGNPAAARLKNVERVVKHHKLKLCLMPETIDTLSEPLMSSRVAPPPAPVLHHKLRVC